MCHSLHVLTLTQHLGVVYSRRHMTKQSDQENTEPPLPTTTINPEQFRKAYQQGFERTVRFVGSRGVYPGIAEETAQAAWTKGWQRRAQLRNPKKILPWINTIALNLLRGRKRKESREQELLETPDIRSRQAAMSARVDVARLLRQCGTTDRKLLGLHHMEGHTTAEAGRRCGLKPVAARVRLMRLRRRLRKKFLLPLTTARRASSMAAPA